MFEVVGSDILYSGVERKSCAKAGRSTFPDDTLRVT